MQREQQTSQTKHQPVKALLPALANSHGNRYNRHACDHNCMSTGSFLYTSRHRQPSLKPANADAPNALTSKRPWGKKALKSKVQTDGDVFIIKISREPKAFVSLFCHTILRQMRAVSLGRGLKGASTHLLE